MAATAVSSISRVVALTLLLRAEASAQQRFGAFEVRSDRDALTGEPVVIAATSSHEDGPMVSLVWRCAPEPEVALSFLRMQVVGSDASGLGGTLPIHWWFDDRAERQDEWDVASRGQRLALPDQERVAFTALARGAQRVYVRFDGSPGGKPTYTFDLSGVETALSRLPCMDP